MTGNKATPHNRPVSHPASTLGPILSDRNFARLSNFIHTECGIKMPPGKRTMLEGRLRKRLRSLGMESFSKYCDYVLSPEGMDSECIHMIDVVSTNKTDFFRESAHFDYLFRVVLPEMVDRGIGTRMRLNAWSAGCSSGEEAYTLSMVLNEFCEKVYAIDFAILATDISTRILDKARRGIYEHSRIEPVPIPMRKKYLMRSKDRGSDLVRIAPEVREQVTFQRLNFMDDVYGVPAKMGFVFCRNVLIYFDRMTQEKVLSRICRHLAPGGYLFTGHSETIQGLNLPLTSVANTVYRKV